MTEAQTMTECRASYGGRADRQLRLVRVLARARQRQLDLASAGRYLDSARYALLSRRIRYEFEADRSDFNAA